MFLKEKKSCPKICSSITVKIDLQSRKVFRYLWSNDWKKYQKTTFWVIFDDVRRWDYDSYDLLSMAPEKTLPRIDWKKEKYYRTAS